MKTDNSLAIAFFAVVIGGAVALAIASDIAAPLCDAAKIKSVAPDKIEFGCLEFWLNRYQTMLAAFMGAGIALFVVRPVFSQLKEMAKQSAASAKSLVEQLATEVDEEIDALVRADNGAFGLSLYFYDFEVDEWDWDPHFDYSNAQALAREFREELTVSRRNARRHLGDNDIRSARAEFLRHANGFEMFVARYRGVASANAERAVSSVQGQANAKARLKAAGDKATKSFEQLNEANERLSNLLSAVSEAKWRAVRELEQRAQDPA